MGKVYYKGFNKDMTCRGFQFEEGKTYEEPEAKLCEKGFHACENPLDCFRYYAPTESVYHVVELEDVQDKKSDDSKVCAKKISVGARLDVAGIVKAHFEYVTERCEKVNGSVAGDREAVSVKEKQACSAGECGSASAGYKGSASAGRWGSASAGQCGLAACRGGRAKGGIGCMLALCEVDDKGNNKNAVAVIVDGEKVKTDTWYTLKNGELIEA